MLPGDLPDRYAREVLEAPKVHKLWSLRLARCALILELNEAELDQ
jgi:hypothetical protein